MTQNRAMILERRLFSSGSAYEPRIGYSRAVRVGPFVFVSGTTASSPDGPVGGDDAAAQAEEVLRRIGAVLEQAGAHLEDVVRTRIFLTSMDDFESVGRAHGAAFGDIRPATSIVGASGLADPALLVEIEADAVIPDGASPE